jgi:PAS domain-containing protein
MRRPEHAIAEIEFAGKVWRGELINLRKDGTRYIEEMSITPLRDTHETIVNFIAIKRDVTERRATESALQSSEKSLANVQHMVPMGSWELESQTGEFRGSPGSLLFLTLSRSR